MGLIERAMGMVFGGGGNVIRETAEVFRENAEGAAQRNADLRTATLEQFTAEFAAKRRGPFERFINALNRVPRPALAMGTLALFASAMWDPAWFAARMEGIALVPEPLWWLMGAIVSFYFGGRYQIKAQEFRRSLAETMARAPTIAKVEGSSAPEPDIASTTTAQGIDAATPETTVARGPIRTAGNAALEDWRRSA